MTDARVQDLLETLGRLAAGEMPQGARLPDVAWLASATDEEVEQLLAAIVARPPLAQGPADAFLGAIFQQLRGRWRSLGFERIGHSAVSLLSSLYRQLGAASKARCHLLQVLAGDQGPEALRAFADLVADDPPQDRSGVGIAFSPLFQHKAYDASCLFPRLLQAICHPCVAAAVIDLCNFVTREGLSAKHPAAARRGQLAALLGELAQRLASIEELPQANHESLPKVARQVDDGVAMAIALCDAMGLIGDDSVVGKLHQVLSLKHRRLRTEAAAALAKLGEEAGRECLIALAAEPVCRPRVIAYARELGMLDRIDDKYRTPLAQAEAELALWLAQPSQLSIPPMWLELIDTRTQYWPGFDQPVDCFLLRFTYQLAEAQYSNIGIAGPLTHAFAADLADLPLDDIYAAFAGWHVQHEEVYEVEIDALSDVERPTAVHLERRLRDRGYDGIQPLKLGHFFGERMLVAQAVRDGCPGIGVVDERDVQWHPSAGRQRPIGAHEACSIYKGRKLLRSFNP